MSNNDLGDSTGVGPYAATTVEADSSISAGDAVALDQSSSDARYPLADATNSGTADIDQVFGIAKEDASDGDRFTVQTSGSVIANVESTISQGARLTSGTTAGRLADGDGTPIVAFSAAAGTDSADTSLGTNEAEVIL